jgi:hypothetical protein
LLFFGVPIVIAGMLICFYGELRMNLAAVLAISLATFASLLVNLLLMIQIVIKLSEPQDVGNSPLRQRLISEVFSNISFTILVATAALMAIFFFVLLDGIFVAKQLFSFLAYYLVSLLLLTLLMLLKRTHILIWKEIYKGTGA